MDKQKILFSPLGGTDPISNFRDGSMLHICRIYKPDIVILYMSKEMYDYHVKDKRYLYCLDKLSELIDHKFEVKLIERPELTEDVREQVNINIKYDGYIKRQIKQVKQFKKLESKKLPPNFDYNQISGLRMEAQQKLNLYQPISIGQASRISGVSPADISVILVYLEQLHYQQKKEHEQDK